MQFDGIKRGELREAGIEKHGYVLEDDRENATWHKPQGCRDRAVRQIQSSIHSNDTIVS